MKPLVATIMLVMAIALAASLYVAANSDGSGGEPFASIAVEPPEPAKTKLDPQKPKASSSYQQPAAAVTISPDGRVGAQMPALSDETSISEIVMPPGISIGTGGITVSIPPDDGPQDTSNN